MVRQASRKCRLMSETLVARAKSLQRDNGPAMRLLLPICRSGAEPANPPCNRSGEIAMAINLTSIVTQFLTPEVIAQIASFFGIDRSAAQKAVDAAVPTMLASLANLVETPAGTSQLSKLLSQQQGSPMDL